LKFPDIRHPLRELEDINRFTHSREGKLFCDGVWIGVGGGIVFCVLMIRMGVFHV
jgi:hypothetical protein